MKFVVKRNGKKEELNPEKIFKAVGGALKSTGDYTSSLCTSIVDSVLQEMFETRVDRSVEEIQDMIETTLLALGYVQTARSFIRYREQRAKLRKDKEAVVNAVSTINEYVRRDDWRVNANANQGYSLGGMILNVSGKVTANYWLSHVYTPEIGTAHKDGYYHIHDLDMLAGYCAGWSLRQLLQEGFNGVPGKCEAKPPKHLSSAVGQMVNFLGTLQNEWAGAQAFSSFDTYLAPFVRVDKLPYKMVRQYIQELIYNLNVPSRWGTQTPFTNLTFDLVCPEDLREEHPWIGGEIVEDFTYGDLQEEMDMINRAYLEVMSEGDAKGRIFTFPIPTYNITKDFDWDGPNTELLFEVTAKYGLPYFQNFINSELNPGQIRSMCCRLQLDLTQLEAKGNGLFGSGEQTGSIGVVTLNLARLGYENQLNTDMLLASIEKYLDLAKESLELKRRIVQQHMDNGLFPFTKRYLGTLKNHFSTIGINGMNEMIRNFTQDRNDITTDVGKELAERVLVFIREKLIEYQKETGHLYNLEATPAEGATHRMAKTDLKQYPDIITAGTKERPYYTNSSQLPVGYTDDLFEALDHQDTLQTMYTGGTVMHMYMKERISSSEQCKRLIKKVLELYHMPYYTVSPTFSICPIHGYIEGEHEYCPKCDEELLNGM